MHNAVNEKLAKPICSMERSRMLWRHKRTATNTTQCVFLVATLEVLHRLFRSLDRWWNWQLWFKDFAEGLEKAYIVHFANARNRLEVISKYIATEQSQVQKVTV